MQRLKGPLKFAVVVLAGLIVSIFTRRFFSSRTYQTMDPALQGLTTLALIALCVGIGVWLWRDRKR